MDKRNDVNPASRRRQPRRQEAPAKLLRQLEEAQAAARQERAAARQARHEAARAETAGRHTGKGAQAQRDERRRQGSLQGRGAAAAEAAGQAPAFPDEALLALPEQPTLEQRVAAWLDVLVYAWRRRSQGAKARFQRNARLSDAEAKRLGAGVKQLSHGFTGHRRLVGASYLQDPELLGAYLLFYWPVSYAQAWTVLDDLRRRLGGLSFARVADLGSGPGPLCCAMLDAARAEGADCRALALDHAPEALELLREICRLAYGPGAADRVETQSGDLPELKAAAFAQDGAFDCVGMGHSLNELWPDQGPARQLRQRRALAEDWLGALRPAAAEGKAPPCLLVLEPALREPTRALLGLRDALAAAGNAILGPCFMNAPCPALATPEGTCHGQVAWEQPPVIRRLAAEAKLSKDEIAMSWLAVAKAAPTRAAAGCRVVGEALVNKAGRTRLTLCGPDGRLSLSALLGPEPAGALRDFARLRRGDAIRVDNPEPREGGWGVLESTTITKI